MHQLGLPRYCFTLLIVAFISRLLIYVDCCHQSRVKNFSGCNNRLYKFDSICTMQNQKYSLRYTKIGLRLYQ